jgi:hypothetical protein
MTSAAPAAAFRYLPYLRLRPRLGAVLARALPAALTPHLGSEAFGLVISRSAVASLYGTAGSVILFLLWVHYSAWIVLFGAEVCRAWDDPATAAAPAPRDSAPELRHDSAGTEGTAVAAPALIELRPGDSLGAGAALPVASTEDRSPPGESRADWSPW